MSIWMSFETMDAWQYWYIFQVLKKTALSATNSASGENTLQKLRGGLP